MDLGSNQQPDNSLHATVIHNNKVFYKNPIFLIGLIIIVAFTLTGFTFYGFNNPSTIESTINNFKYQNQINQLNELVKSVQNLNQSPNPTIGDAEFTSQKENIKIQAQQVEDALKAGDIAKAKERAMILKSSIINLGDPIKSKFLTLEEKQSLDPTGLATDAFESVDPTVMTYYQSIIQIVISLS